MMKPHTVCAQREKHMVFSAKIQCDTVKAINKKGDIAPLFHICTVSVKNIMPRYRVNFLNFIR